MGVLSQSWGWASPQAQAKGGDQPSGPRGPLTRRARLPAAPGSNQESEHPGSGLAAALTNCMMRMSPHWACRVVPAEGGWAAGLQGPRALTAPAAACVLRLRSPWSPTKPLVPREAPWCPAKPPGSPRSPLEPCEAPWCPAKPRGILHTHTRWGTLPLNWISSRPGPVCQEAGGSGGPGPRQAGLVSSPQPQPLGGPWGCCPAALRKAQPKVTMTNEH